MNEIEWTKSKDGDGWYWWTAGAYTSTFGGEGSADNAPNDVPAYFCPVTQEWIECPEYRWLPIDEQKRLLEVLLRISE